MKEAREGGGGERLEVSGIPGAMQTQIGGFLCSGKRDEAEDDNDDKYGESGGDELGIIKKELTAGQEGSLLRTISAPRPINRASCKNYPAFAAGGSIPRQVRSYTEKYRYPD